MLKYLFFIFDLYAGLAFATHKFRGRCEYILNHNKIWFSSAQPRSRVRRWIENNFPPKNIIRIGMFFFHKTKIFNIPTLGIKRHYDISNDFYKLFLDKKFMFYTYADFHSESESLEEAQENKANYIADLIDPKPNEKILDVGCGWGAMMKKIVSITNDKENITGYNLSEAQVKYIRDELGYRVILTDAMKADYPRDYYDKIYTVGIIEHIRNRDLSTFSKMLFDSIKPTGHIVHHFFCQKGNYPPPILLGALDIFPGSELASFDRHRRVFEKSGFRIAHHSIHDYRQTLKAWFINLVKNKNRAIELVGVRNYNRYLSYFAYSYRLFDEQLLICNRFVLKPIKQATEKHTVMFTSNTGSKMAVDTVVNFSKDLSL